MNTELVLKIIRILAGAFGVTSCIALITIIYLFGNFSDDILFGVVNIFLIPGLFLLFVSSYMLLKNKKVAIASILYLLSFASTSYFLLFLVG